MKVNQETLRRIAETEIQSLYSAGNSAGNGYPAGDEGDEPKDAAISEGWHVLRILTDGSVVAQKPDGVYVMVGDALGPWCVDLPQETNPIA